jgi:hypothetical protein
VREACRFYGRALSKHSTSIAHDSTSLRAASLYTCVMLSLFEAICSTTSVAYGTHLRAAQKMLALVPREANHGVHAIVISQLGQHVQCQTVRISSHPLTPLKPDITDIVYSYLPYLQHRMNTSNRHQFPRLGLKGLTAERLLVV